MNQLNNVWSNAVGSKCKKYWPLLLMGPILSLEVYFVFQGNQFLFPLTKMYFYVSTSNTSVYFWWRVKSQSVLREIS